MGVGGFKWRESPDCLIDRETGEVVVFIDQINLRYVKDSGGQSGICRLQMVAIFLFFV